MSQISVKNLSFHYEGTYDTIFDNVSLSLDSHWKLGLIGRNGRSKTTFLKLLMNAYPYQGNIHSNVEFEYFPYTVTDLSQTAIEIAYFIYPNNELWELNRECSLLNLDPKILSQSFKTLSRGEQTKILLAILFLKPNQFLLIDEPTNHLDLEGRKTVSAYLQKKSGFILVSHDRIFLDHCVDHILSINKNNLEIQKGNYSSWLLNKEQQDQFEFKQNKKLKKEISQLKTAANRTQKWSHSVEESKNGQRVSGLRPDRGYIGHKSAKMMKRSKTLEKRQQKSIDEKQTLLKNIDWSDSLQIKPIPYKTERLISVSKLSIAYGSHPVFEGLNFEVNQGDRIAVKGLNGSGKSSLLKLLSGVPLTYQGNLAIGSQLKISAVPQNPDKLSGSLTQYSQDQEISDSLFKTILRKFGFERIQFEKDLSAFSEGQKKKVYLARSLCQYAHLYLWDEPLNYIDVLSRIQLEELLLQYTPTMIFIEHDQAFIDHIATKIITL
ncbi:ABC-F type ribosomal protection protein [Eubacteriaceae bacterium ES3]|nr:ABC-F type ribosomal protection protein [Eubacteriaceae bacterium ES3]